MNDYALSTVNRVESSGKHPRLISRKLEKQQQEICSYYNKI